MRQAIYGPPGTGKTTRLVEIIGRCIDAGDVNVTVVSYTKAASEEIAARAAAAHPHGADMIKASTVHSLAFRLGDCKMASTVDTVKLEAFTKVSGIPFSGRRITEDDDIGQLEVGDEYMSIYSLARSRRANFMDTYDASHRPGNAQEYDYFCNAYDEWKSEHGYYDFSDMLTRALDKPFHPGVLVVDEAQDLSPMQWALIYQWARNAEMVFTAGDDDQAIYVWSGADVSGMQNFERDFKADRVVLGQSWRIPGEVHTLAQSIIAPVAGRVDKLYKPRPEPGIVDRYDSFTDVVMRQDESTLILYRNHSLRRDIEDTLISLNIPHVFDNGGRSVLQSPLAAVSRAFENNESWYGMDTDAKRHLSRVYNAKDLQRFEMTDEWPGDPLRSNTQSWRLKSTLSAYRRYGGGKLPTPESCNIHLSSIHGAKGREADHVILLNGMSGKTAMGYEVDKDAERRVFYVGVTRARKRLTIVTVENAVEILL